MNNKEIENLILLISKYNINKIKVKTKDFLIEISKFDKLNNIINKPEKKYLSNIKIIKSPLVGVFYLTPSPGEKPFIKEGDNINKGDIVCIIEVMKNLHKIKSDYTGIIKKIIAKNETFVEYNEDLIIVEDV